MTRDEAVTRLLSRLGNRSAAEYTTPILNWMDDVQLYNLEQDPGLLPWFMITETSSASFTIDEERLEVPADFIQTYEEAELQAFHTESNRFCPITKAHYDEIVKAYVDHSPGLPEKYALVGQYFRVRPIPDQEYVAKLIYYAHQPLPSADNVENTWLKWAADLLLAWTGYEVASKELQDMELAATFESPIAIARKRLIKRNEARMHANFEYSMGED